MVPLDWVALSAVEQPRLKGWLFSNLPREHCYRYTAVWV